MTRFQKSCALAGLAAALIGGAASAQAPAGPTAANPWVTLAPFPEGSEEVLGATAGGKLYVLCGLGPGFKPLGLV
jgi:hypothetical protein